MVKQVEEAGLAIVAIRGPYNAEPEGAQLSWGDVHSLYEWLQENIENYNYLVEIQADDDGGQSYIIFPSLGKAVEWRLTWTDYLAERT
jgi:hypothetical protein